MRTKRCCAFYIEINFLPSVFCYCPFTGFRLDSVQYRTPLVYEDTAFFKIRSIINCRFSCFFRDVFGAMRSERISHCVLLFSSHFFFSSRTCRSAVLPFRKSNTVRCTVRSNIILPILVDYKYSLVSRSVRDRFSLIGTQ